MAKSKILTKIGEVLFPHYACPMCDRETLGGVLCPDCQKFVIKPNYCEVCGEHVGAKDKLCMSCKETKRSFDKSFSVFEYNQQTARAILAMKYREKRYLAKDFAKLLHTKYVEAGIACDVVCFVPSSPKRLKKRGYNHAEDLAKEFCKLADLPCKPLLDKIKETEHQTELTREQRKTNVIDAFVCTDKQSAKGKVVLLLDDVFTTGSTLQECSKALKKARPKKIYCLTIAKTILESV